MPVEQQSRIPPGTIPIAVVVLIGAALRLFELDMHSLLVDEAFVALGARDIAYNGTPMWDAVSNAPWVWGLGQLFLVFGNDSEWIVRLPSVIAGVVTVYLTFALARRLMDARVAIVASLLVAIHPFALAFNRVAFVDSLQVMAVMGAMLFCERWIATHRRTDLAFASCFTGAAFLFKYNAVVMFAVWLVCALAARRYTLRQVFALSGVGVLGCAFVIALWPYDQLIWLYAFGGKGGTYNVMSAVHFFTPHIREVFLGTTLILVPTVCMRLLSKSEKEGKSVWAHLALFTIVYLVTIVLLGRPFQRYLLILIPIVATLTAAGFWWLADLSKSKGLRPIPYLAFLSFAPLALYTLFDLTQGYLGYLNNDVDERAIVKEVTAIMGQDRNVHWWTDEPITAYYLGFTQYYSRSIRGGLDRGVAERTYSNGIGTPFAQDTRNEPVLAARAVLRSKGLAFAAQHPAEIVRLAQDTIVRLKVELEKIYLGGTERYTRVLRPGDIGVAYGGVRHAAGEPFLVPIERSTFQAPRNGLPTDEFFVWKSFRPEGVSSLSDTDLTQFKRAGAWIMIKK